MILKKRGFHELSDNIFEKGNVQMHLFGTSEISKLRISVQDPAYKDVVILITL